MSIEKEYASDVEAILSHRHDNGADLWTTVKPINDASVYLYMLKKESEGKAKKVAKIATLNKFLKIYYARVNEVCQA